MSALAMARKRNRSVEGGGRIDGGGKLYNVSILLASLACAWGDYLYETQWGFMSRR